MRVTIGEIGTSGKWRIEVQAPGKEPARFERDSRGDAERLGAQLTGGRRDRIRWKGFPADTPAKAPAKAPAIDTARATRAARVTTLLGQSARKVIDAIEDGAFDADLDAIKAAENGRERGPRKTVLREIKRQVDLAG